MTEELRWKKLGARRPVCRCGHMGSYDRHFIPQNRVVVFFFMVVTTGDQPGAVCESPAGCSFGAQF
jgi:hypothetical protein